MAIAFDAAAQDGGAQVNPTQTWTHTTGTLTDGVMVLFIQIQPTSQVSGTPTYNGVSMTQQVAWQAGGTTFDWSYAYTLVNPSSGANTVSVSHGGGSNRYVYTVSGTYSGVDQTNPLGATPVTATQASAGSTSQTTSLTTNVDNAWLVGMGGAVSGGSGVAAGTDTTRRATAYADYAWHALLDSNGAKTPTGSYSLQHTGTSDRRSMTMIQLAPAGGGGGGATLSTLMLMGLG